MTRLQPRVGVRRLFRLEPRTPSAAQTEIDEELDAFIAARVDLLVSRGVPRDDALRQALGRFGNDLDRVRRELHASARLRDRRIGRREHVENIIQDLRYSVRGLQRRPLFTLVAVATLAIGMGATTAIYTAVDVMLVRPLPFADPGRLTRLTLAPPAVNGVALDEMPWSYPKARMFRAAQTTFDNVALYVPLQATVRGDGPELVRGERVDASYLRTLGLSPLRGRDFDPALDDHPGNAREALIAESFWRRHYDGDPRAVGRTIDVEGSPYTIIGVGPSNFHGLTGEAELFIPIASQPASAFEASDMYGYSMIGRRKIAIGAAQAAAAVAALGNRVSEALPDEMTHGRGWSANARPLDDARVAPLVKRSLLLLLAAVALVLLIACVNVASLLMSRGDQRRREIAVRRAVGASRSRLVRLLVAESLVLSGAGAVASVAVARAGIRALSAVDPAALTIGSVSGLGGISFSTISLDWRALVFTLAMAVVTGLVFGVAPALRATRGSLAEEMKDDRGAGAGRRSFSGRALVVAEVALALVLLASSALVIRSLSNLLAVDPGFDARNVLTLRLELPDGAGAPPSMSAFYSGLLGRLRALPAVEDVSLASCAPLAVGCNRALMQTIPGSVAPSPGRLVQLVWTTPTWFATNRIALHRGRLLTPEDRDGTRPVVIINEAAAKKYWPNENPIGKRATVSQGGFDKGAEVVGVVADVKHSRDSLARPSVYISYDQSPNATVMVFLRTSGNPGALGPDVRRAIREVAPSYPVYDMRTMIDRAGAGVAQTRFCAILFGVFAAAALALALVGIYGVMSLAVSRRTREIGIRIALGAGGRGIERLIVGDGMRSVFIGAVVGVVGALAATRLLRSLLFEITPADPPTYAGVVLLMVGAAFLAGWLPARRASCVDPLITMRAE